MDHSVVPHCPVCYEVVREPVVFPCRHELCKNCFQLSVESANLHCPLCRSRVSSWARRHAKDPVDQERMRDILRQLQETNKATNGGSLSSDGENVWVWVQYLVHVCV